MAPCPRKTQHLNVAVKVTGCHVERMAAVRGGIDKTSCRIDREQDLDINVETPLASKGADEKKERTACCEKRQHPFNTTSN